MESLYTRLDALKREMLRENASVVGLGDDGDDVEVEDEEMREGQRRERRGTDGIPAPSPSIGVEEVTSRVTAQNAASPPSCLDASADRALKVSSCTACRV